MQRRPWMLVILSVLHFLAPIGNLIFNAFITNQSILSYFVKASSPQYLITNWVIIVIPIIAGLSIYACQRWSFFAYLISITILFIFSYAGYASKPESISLLPVIFVYLINIGVVTYFLVPAVRNIYFDRRMRWWEIQNRYQADFNCSWFDAVKNKWTPGKVLNISLNGLFLKSDELPRDKENIKILLNIKDDEKFEFQGESIMHGQSNLFGFGVKFEHTKESRIIAKRITADLDKKGLRVSHSELRPEDSFSYWVRTLLTTGKGALPSKISIQNNKIN